MTTDIDALAPLVAERARELLDRIVIEQPVSVTSTRRSIDEQLALFAQGRAPLEIVNLLRQKAGMRGLLKPENTYTVTNCDGVTKRSAHQDGRALDIVPLDGGRPSWDYAKMAEAYRGIGEVAREMGWTCGMDWLPINPVTGLGADPPHFELG